jgi:hypothetical protein
MMKKRSRYKGHLITVHTVEHEPTPLGHRRFGASFSVAGVSNGGALSETVIDFVFVSPEFAADYAVIVAKQRIEAELLIRPEAVAGGADAPEQGIPT